NLPKIFSVNWFRKDKNKFLWPGYGENARVIKWIFERCHELQKILCFWLLGISSDDSNAAETPIGMVPKLNSLDLSGIKMENVNEIMQKVFHISEKEWFAEAEKYEQFYEEFGDRLPKKCLQQLENLRNRLTKHTEKNTTKTT
ncbi:phosphoenolpyruvate carboxykinase, partial [Reticulomyxa filosa]